MTEVQEELQEIDYKTLTKEQLIISCREKDKQLATIHSALEQEYSIHQGDMKEATKDISYQRKVTKNLIDLFQAKEDFVFNIIESTIGLAKLDRTNIYPTEEEVTKDGNSNG